MNSAKHKLLHASLLTSLTTALAFNAMEWPSTAQQPGNSPAQLGIKSEDIDRISQQLGLDANASQTMKEALKKGTSVRQAPNQAIRNFTKQLSRSITGESSAPPSDFPAPVFRGANTVYRSASQSNFVEGSTSISFSLLGLTTSDSAQTVSTWYKRALSQSGWSLSDPFKDEQPRDAAPSNRSSNARSPTRQQAPPNLLAQLGISATESISADKASMRCTVQITELSATRQTKVCVSVSK